MERQSILKKIEALEAQAKKGVKVIITHTDGKRNRCELCEAIAYFTFNNKADIRDVSIIGDKRGQGILPDLLLFLAEDHKTEQQNKNYLEV